MFIAVLFTIAKIWKQAHVPISRWADKKALVSLHSGILLSHKKKEILPFEIAWMDLETILLNKISQSEKDKYHMISLIWESNEQNKLTNKTETDS